VLQKQGSYVRGAHRDPTYETPYEQFAKPLVQFPPAPVSTAPDWLRNQETQWVKTKAKR